MAPSVIPAGHPTGYIDCDEWYCSYEEDDPMVDNEPENSVAGDLEEKDSGQGAMEDIENLATLLFEPSANPT